MPERAAGPAVFDPADTYVRLAPDGTAQPLPGGEPFWSLPAPELERLADGWLVTAFECDSDWSSWEMHPDGDEFVCLLSGAATLRLEAPDGLQEIALAERGAVIVPRGVWHTARVSRPSRMLFVTRGRGTRHRSA